MSAAPVSTMEVVPDPEAPAPGSAAALAAAAARFGVSPRVRPLPRVTTHPSDIARALLAKTPPAEWERDVQRISPVSEAHSFLKLVWMETPPDHPSFRPDQGRWCLYECIPDAMLSTERRHQLQTPYWELPAGQQMGRQQMASAFQFELYRTHRVDARPFWVLQGNQGGTPASYTDLEQKLLRLAQQPTSPPKRGELPYAPWDQRARDAIVRRDRLRMVSQNIDRLRKMATTDAMRAEADMAEREFRKALMAWWADKFEEHADFLVWYTRRTESDRTLHRMTREEARRAAAFEEQYVETGVA